MERHPVPQNIMDVEFKLFGSLTVRQFANLALGILIAVFLYFLGLPGIIKWPLITFVVLMGIALALVKVNGQTFGKWLGNFVVAMFTNQRKVWKKSPKVPELFTKTYKAQNAEEQILTTTKKQLPAFLQRDLGNSSEMVDRDEQDRLNKLDYYIQNGPNSSATKGTAKENKLETPVVDPSKGNLAGNLNPIQDNIDNYSQSKNYAVVSQGLNQKVNRPISNKLIHKNLADTLGSIDRVVEESAGSDKHSVGELTEANKILQDRVKNLQKENEEAKDSGFEKIIANKTISNKPNAVAGLIIDKANSPIGGVRVIIKDLKGNLVRSILGDKDGYFATATALQNGDYVIELESDTYSFDKFKVNLDGKKAHLYKFVAK